MTLVEERDGCAFRGGCIHRDESTVGFYSHVLDLSGER
jgi:hypothetical protein